MVPIWVPLPLQPWTSKTIGPSPPQSYTQRSPALVCTKDDFASFASSRSASRGLKSRGVINNFRADPANAEGNRFPNSFRKKSRRDMFSFDAIWCCKGGVKTNSAALFTWNFGKLWTSGRSLKRSVNPKVILVVHCLQFEWDFHSDMGKVKWDWVREYWRRIGGIDRVCSVLQNHDQNLTETWWIEFERARMISGRRGGGEGKD